MDATKVNNTLLARQECMSAQTSATKLFVY